MYRFLAILTAGLVASCAASDDPGLRIDIATASPSSPLQPGGTRIIETNLGYRVELTRGYLATGLVELPPCQHHSAATGGLGDRLLDLLVPRAFAHGDGSPVKLAIPLVESLLAPQGSAAEIGTLEPPPGLYCAVLYTAAAADDDALGLPDDVDMVGTTLFLAGTFQAHDATEVMSFEIISSRALPATISLNPPLELSASGRHSARVTIHKDPTHWFDDLDLRSMSPNDFAEAVVSNIGASLTATVE
ncbi:hypothetical protein [Vulgatibacter incomptus]|uniref:Lipoprotein n=1 Tax=Vulgatibacter incomptus TaxID=1391653 RepID=A0A0K1PD26_9BACT|nr:hypothetical protein [Vulgatibacter incomptus]AKU91301.1 hypothetical protein AKJ08_1688 [Vulgatibacter incomptus]